MKEGLEKRFADAIKLQKDNQLELARNLLLELAQQDPRSVRILAALGSVYYDLGAWDEAASVFRRGIAIAPTLEGISKGLFHSLWKLERRVEALEEVKRFQAVSNSDDYLRIIEEINEKW